jgi:hypothetical protein
MLAFYTLAVCRGLIPGLCATQNALDARFCPPAAESNSAQTCCTRTPLPGSADVVLFAGTPDRIECAFCSLITTTVRPAQAPMAPAAVPVAGFVCVLAHAAPDVSVTWDPIQRRGPPTLA